MKKSSLFKLTLLACLGQLHGATFEWTATTPGSDLNSPGNWTPSGPPGSGDIANFSSTLSHVDFNPVTSTPFSTGEMNFLQSASPFSFTFTNTTLTFQGASVLNTVGITGPSRNPTILINNTNTTLGTPQLSFLNFNASYGSGQITVKNTSVDTSTLVPAQIASTSVYAYMDSGLTITVENSASSSLSTITSVISNQTAFGSVEALDHVTITCSNNGSNGDNSANNSLGVITSGNQISSVLTFSADDYFTLTLNNTGSSGVNTNANKGGVISNNQAFMPGLFTLANNGTIQINNSGTNSGTTNTVGEVGICQILNDGSFSAGDNLNWNITNTGVNTVNAYGNNVVANVVFDQASLYSFTTGNLSTVSVSNNGTNSSTNSSGAHIATVGDQAQFFVTAGPFLAGDDLQLSVTNVGMDGSQGAGSNLVGVVPGQVRLTSQATVGENARIAVSNIGTATGITGGKQQVGFVNVNNQWNSGFFSSGDGLQFTVSNAGTNNDPGGLNNVGDVRQQLTLNGGSVGSNSSLTVTNTGINTQGFSNNVGYVNNSQLLMQTPFDAEDYFNLKVTNAGTDSSVAVTGNQVGVAISQAVFDTFAAEDYATIVISNTGINNGNTMNSTAGLSINQFSTNTFSVGDNFLMNISNAGSHTGSGSGNNVGYLNGTMLNAQVNFSVGDNASITLSNTGTMTDGTNTDVGFVGFGVYAEVFTAGDNLILNATNAGSNTSGGTANSVGVVGTLVNITGDFSVGDNATINLLNFGSYSGLDAGTMVGVTNEEFVCDGFSAGENLSFIATNTAVNPNSLPNVGLVTNQIDFAGTATFNNGTLIKAVNSGTVAGTQILFQQPFNVLGKVTFEAINTGTIGTGIDIVNSGGGDINVILQNSSLLVNNATIGVPFIMGALNGDASSTATSTTNGFIIDTDPGVNATFAGTMDTFLLIKRGLGTQNISGTVNISGRRITGLVSDGVLNLTGTINGDMTVRAPGILTGSGTISGAVTNDGTVFPNKTLTVGTFINDGSGVLAIDVTAQSGNGLIRATNATLNGGTLQVGSFDGTYLFYNRYNVINSANPISGAFDAATAVSPLIRPVISYDNIDVFVTLQQNISAAAFTHNQRAVASVLDAATEPTLAESLLISQLADLSIPLAAEALDSISGEQYTNETFFNETVNRQFIRRLYDPIRFLISCPSCYDPCGENLTTWFEAGGDFTFIDGARLNGVELTGGLQKRFSKTLLAGIGVAYEGDNISYRDHGGWQHKDTGMVGLYALYRPACFYILADLAYGYSGGSFRREIHIGDNSFRAMGRPTHSQVTFYGESGIDFCVRNIKIQPFVGVEANSYWRNLLNESNGDGWGLRLDSRNRSAAYTRLGVHLTACVPFRVSVDAAWDYRCTSLDNQVHERLQSFVGDIEVYGVKIARSSFDYALTFEQDLSSDLRAYVETTGQIYNRAQTFTVLGGISLRW